ncbi:MAG: ribosome maturation factor RimM [Silvanigrellaceae bacterium]|nr:ribosome maturation factor RimM [Silvanigrellaceae bacterium]
MLKQHPEKNSNFVSAEGWILFAQVGRPHGLKGAFFLKTSDRRTTWDHYKNLLIELPQGFLPVKVLNSYNSGKALVVHLERPNSREEVEAFYNKNLFVHKDEIVIDQNEFLVAELTGFKVIDSEKGVIGEVSQVVCFGAQDNLEIKITNSDKMALFPFIDAFVKKVDKENRVIEIIYTPEFFEDI